MNNTREVLSKALIPLYKKLMARDFRNDMLEILFSELIFNPEEEYLDYGNTKPASREYIENEMAWYMSKELSIKGHRGIETNKIWQSCAADDGSVNSNYGNLVFAEPSQFKSALLSLSMDMYTRQAVIIYNRPDMHTQSKDNVHAKNDFICTMYTQFFIADDKLEMVVDMRSNDAIYGLQNDYSWQRFVYMEMFDRLKKLYNLKYGKIIWRANSLHIYPRHFNLLEKIIGEF